MTLWEEAASVKRLFSREFYPLCSVFSLALNFPAPGTIAAHLPAGWADRAPSYTLSELVPSSPSSCPCQHGPAGIPPLTFLFPSSLISSEEWQKVSKSEREKMGVTVQDDGEFW